MKSKNKTKVDTIMFGVQSYDEVKTSIGNLGQTIADSDGTSTVMDKQRILSMRTLVDLFEKYTNIGK